MKVVLRSSSLPLTLLGILMNVGVSRVDTGLRRGVVGRLRIGTSIDDVKCGVGVDSGGQPAVTIGSGPEPDVLAEFLNGSLIRCQVMSRKYGPRKGLESDLEECRVGAAYELVWEEPGVAFVKILHMRFVVQDGRVVKILVS